MTNRPGLIRTMDAVEGGAEIEGAGTERVFRATCHKCRQIRAALAHFCRRAPIRPFALLRDLFSAAPAEAFLADGVTRHANEFDPILAEGILRVVGGDDALLPVAWREPGNGVALGVASTPLKRGMCMSIKIRSGR